MAILGRYGVMRKHWGQGLVQRLVVHLIAQITTENAEIV